MKEGLKSEAEWAEIIREWERSGQPRKTWCREQGIVYSQFQYWYHKQLQSRTQETSGEVGEEPGRTKKEAGQPRRRFMAIIPEQERSATTTNTLYQDSSGAGRAEPIAAASSSYGEAKHLRVNLTATGLSMDIPEDYDPQFVASLLRTLRASC